MIWVLCVRRDDIEAMKRRAVKLVGVGALAIIACESPGEERQEAAYQKARQEMVSKQIKARGIRDERVLAAMAKVPRHEFVPAQRRRHAYLDSPLPIGHDQTISQPYMVAFMTEQLESKPGHRVLEIGTGSGYQAAVLALLVKEVYSIEIVKPLAERAVKDLKRLGYGNVTVKAGDGYRGWKEHAPFDAVIVTCAPDHVPEPLVEQLREGGRMIIPVGKEGTVQSLYVMTKKGGKMQQEAVVPVRFVPMTGEVGKRRE